MDWRYSTSSIRNISGSSNPQTVWHMIELLLIFSLWCSIVVSYGFLWSSKCPSPCSSVTKIDFGHQVSKYPWFSCFFTVLCSFLGCGSAKKLFATLLIQVMYSCKGITKTVSYWSPYWTINISEEPVNYSGRIEQNLVSPSQYGDWRCAGQTTSRYLNLEERAITNSLCSSRRALIRCCAIRKACFPAGGRTPQSAEQAWPAVRSIFQRQSSAQRLGGQSPRLQLRELFRICLRTRQGNAGTYPFVCLRQRDLLVNHLDSTRRRWLWW